MAMKVYSAEFKADAVALYLSDPAQTYASVAKNLGVNREPLWLWVRQARSRQPGGETAGRHRVGKLAGGLAGKYPADDGYPTVIPW